MRKLKPRFFCDNCGYEASDTDKSCLKCGRLFVSVRCPVCGYSGPDKIFQNGCPLCGYSAPPVPKAAKERKPKKKKDRVPNEPLPLWAYFVAIAAFFAALFFFYQLLSR